MRAAPGGPHFVSAKLGYRYAVLFEDYSLLLLVAHAAGALSCVALTTHLLLWLRPWRKDAGNHYSVRRFALLALGAYGFTMLMGMALYPTYRVRVRAEYLENPSAISRLTEEQATAARLAEARNLESRRFRRGLGSAPASASRLSDPAPLSEDERDEIAERAEDRITRGAKLVRWFDVKEHWSALGLMLAAALALLLWVTPSGAPHRGIARTTMGLALASAGIAWFAAIVGIVITAARSVAGV